MAEHGHMPILPHSGLFKTDRIVGTAQLKLEALETTCEVREIIEVRMHQCLTVPSPRWLWLQQA